MNHALRTSATLGIALFSGLAALGCPGTLADKECFLQEERARTILVASCTYSGCHSTKSRSTGLDLEAPGAGKRLSNKESLTCDGKLIDPGKPDTSIVYLKLSDPPPCGSRMPLTHPELEPGEKESIRLWILGLDGSCSGAGTSTGGTGGTTSSTGGSGGTTSSTGGGGTGGTTTSTGGGGSGGTTSTGGTGGTTGGTAGTGGM